MRPSTRSLRQQAGAVGLLIAVFLIIAVLVLGQVSLRRAATSVNDSLLSHDVTEALLLAESGLERATAQLAAGTVTCGAALSGTWSYAGGTITIPDIGANFTRDFAGAALPAGRCRIRVSGSTGLFGAQRTIEGIVNTNGNLLGSANANFNDPPGTCNPPGCSPTGWILPAGGWDDSGGPDGSRAAYVEKPSPGSSEVTTAGQFALVSFTVTAPITLTLNFDYKLNTSGGGGQRLELFFRLVSGATRYNASPYPFQTSHTGAFQAGAVTFDLTSLSGPVTIDGLEFDMVAKSGQPKYGWVDNLSMTGSGGSGVANIERWREVVN